MDRQDDGYGLVDSSPVQQTVEVLALQELLFTHEPRKGMRPSLTQHLQHV
jgi:hypothetical protein